MRAKLISLLSAHMRQREFERNEIEIIAMAMLQKASNKTTARTTIRNTNKIQQ